MPRRKPEPFLTRTYPKRVRNIKIAYDLDELSDGHIVGTANITITPVLPNTARLPAKAADALALLRPAFSLSGTPAYRRGSRPACSGTASHTNGATPGLSSGNGTRGTPQASDRSASHKGVVSALPGSATAQDVRDAIATHRRLSKQAALWRAERSRERAARKKRKRACRVARETNPQSNPHPSQHRLSTNQRPRAKARRK